MKHRAISMMKKTDKPTREAKALSLFLMAHKATDPVCKDRLKQINRQWDLVVSNELSNNDYQKQVQKMLKAYGGYMEVVEKTVQFYIDKSGAWTLQGDDQYCKDAQQIANKILNA